MEPRSTPVIAGVTAALVGFTSSFAVVLAGLRAAGASPEQAASGLLALCVVLGAGTVALTRRHRIPVTLAWSTPGAALLATTGATDGGWPAAVGAFLVVAALILCVALWPRLGDLLNLIPAGLAQAMLAGVLLPLCLAPVDAVAASPAVIGPTIATWVLALALARRWAVPLAFAAAIATVVAHVVHDHRALGSVVPEPVWTTPHLTTGAVLGLAVPLFLVTVASQNLPGVAVLASYGFAAPWRSSIATTGAGTALAAPFGGHAVNLAAITAALTASPEAHPEPKRRWLAAHAAGWTYLALAAASPLLVALVVAGPDGVVEAVAGLALLATLASATSAALSGDGPREPAVVTLVVAASGTTILGVGSAFWSLVAGLVVHAVVHVRSPGEPAHSGTRR